MTSTIGTIVRAILIMTVIISGWFLSLTTFYSLMIFVMGWPFSWLEVWCLFGAVILVKMFYPRNVFVS